jgi:apolipoprotein N-acyltransferase
MHWWPATAASIGAAYYFMTKGRSLFWWGAGYAVANFHWSLESIFANDQIAAALWWLYPIGLIGIALAGGAIFSLPFWMTRRTAMSGWRRTLLFALAWTFVLWLREWMLTGFPWNPLANILIDSGAASIMPIAGAIGMTFMVAGTIGSVPEFLITKAKWQFLFFVPLLLAAVWSPRDGDAAPRGLRVRLVQPAFDMNRKFDRAEMDENIKTLVDLSKNPTNPETGEPDMIVWPETAYPYAVNDSVKMPALGIPLVFGAVYYDGGRFYNAMILSDKDGGIMDKYFKSHLVPFGEYRPFGDIIPTPGQLSAGRGPKEMSLSGALFFPAICYEIVFSDSITRIPNPESRTAGFILNITNDAWFGKSWGPRQHLDMARRQAMETGLPVVRANYGGISAVIDSRGRILQSLPIGVRGTLDAEIPGPRKTSYRRIGLNGAMLAITLSCAAILILTRRHKRQSPRSQRPN